MQLQCYISSFTDPYLNLAIENKLLLSNPSNCKTLFLYVNRACVVLGRFQNPWVECNQSFMKENDIWLVRRQSGGGCVYHDFGNLNFSFIDSQRQLDKDFNNQVVLKALEAFSIKAYSSERTDLYVFYEGEKRKISGSAFKQKKERHFHHGTLLVEADMDLLRGSLKSPQFEIKSKSIESVRSKSLCLKELNSQIQIDNLINTLSNQFGSLDTITIKEDFLTHDIQEESKRLQSWDWVYGETPEFLFENKIVLKKAIVVEVKEKSLLHLIGKRVDEISFLNEGFTKSL